MSRRKFWFAAGAIAGAVTLAIILKPSATLASNGVTGITVVAHRNLTSVAIAAIVQGDDDSSATFRIFQRWQGASSYDSGMVMVRRPHGGGASALASGEIFEGRILWMTAGRTAEFYLECVDATSGTTTTAVDTVSCARVRTAVATGTVYYVDGVNGNAANTGLSQAQALKTINQALTKMNALADDGAGGGIRVMTGEYHETVTLNFGTDGQPRFIEGMGDRDSIIICGANEGVETASPSYTWVKIEPTAPETDSVYVTPFTMGDSTQLVVLGWGEMLHRKTSLKALFADSTYAYTGASFNHGEVSGWWWSGDSLYVKRRNGASPAGLTLHTGYRNSLVWIQAPYWRVANITIRYGGGVSGDETHRANVNPGMTGYGIRWGNSGDGSNAAVDSLKIYGCNNRAIHNSFSFGAAKSDSSTITNCYVDGLTVGGMYYGAAKSRAEEPANEIGVASMGTSVVNNFLTGSFNGIGSTGPGATDSLSCHNVEFVNNTVTNLSDDGFEPDVSNCFNLLICNNTVRNAGSAISTDPIYTGPVWVIYNRFVQSKSRGFKIGGGSTAHIKAYHNTVTSTSPFHIAVESTTGTTDNMEFRNNIFIGRVAAGSLFLNSDFSLTTNSFNYDLLDSISTTRVANIASTGYSLASLRSTFNWEKNGKQIKAWFADSTTYDYRVSKTSPAWKGGMRLAGINTSLDGNRYPTLPTIGAENCACTDQ